MASTIARASAEDISGGSTCISTEFEGDAAITEALQGVGGSLLVLLRSWQMSKLAEPTTEGPICAGGVAGPGAGIGESSGGVVGM
jgi:hypothetical protein